MVRSIWLGLAMSIAVGLSATGWALAAESPPGHWKWEWSKTDFSQASVPFSEILSGGPPKDGIPAIDDPKLVPLGEAGDLQDLELVIGFAHEGDARAYPLRVLMWHEIVNDVVGGAPVTVTYCPLCNAAIVFDRRVEVGGEVRTLDFGTTGKLRKSDLVMYDRQTESWWQQFLGEAIVGELTGTRLKVLPARLESWASFRARHPDGQVLVPRRPSLRSYGRNPYRGYDQAATPFLYDGSMPDGIAPMEYVVVADGKAWALSVLAKAGRIEDGDLVLSWTPGANSALDSGRIWEGADIGNVVVQRRCPQHGLQDVPYDLTFAFVFHAFNPEAEIRTR
ncbi:MAG: DUF3179 domain-containing protein [Alphaproteobacteria bacterium]|nr:DUF3179 domain-containing protein [Alphaproteobacteria bacterium]